MAYFCAIMFLLTKTEVISLKKNLYTVLHYHSSIYKIFIALNCTVPCANIKSILCKISSLYRTYEYIMFVIVSMRVKILGLHSMCLKAFNIHIFCALDYTWGFLDVLLCVFGILHRDLIKKDAGKPRQVNHLYVFSV